MMCEENSQPMVTIRCLTYNHAPYIRQCLDGFVMQKTNFRFEAIVHDDASTDGTAAIVKEYGDKYPEIIKPILETENQYSKHDGSLGRIVNAHMHGKYIAMCEGDDYWTDPLKLQKQVDFLESHPDFTMCFHSAMIKWEKQERPDGLFYKVEDREYFGTEFFKHWIVATASVVFRTEVIYSDIFKRVKRDKRILYGDTPLFISASKLGRVYGMKDVMSVYRRHEGGMSFNYCFENEIKMIDNNMAVYEIFGREYKKIAINSACKLGIYNYLMLDKSKRPTYKYLLINAFKLNLLLSTVYYLYVQLKYRFLYPVLGKAVRR